MRDGPTQSAGAWERLLDPDHLKDNFVRAGVFLVAFEMLNDAVVLRVQEFFSHTFEAERGWILDEREYREAVLRPYDPREKRTSYAEFFACAQWFERNGALTVDDIELLKRVRDHRNRVAHETLRLATELDDDTTVNLLNAMVGMVEKLDRWWLREIEIPVNPDFDGEDPDELLAAGATSLRASILRLMQPMASGDDEELRSLHGALRSLLPQT